MTYFIDIHFSDIEYFRIFIFCEIILQQMQNKILGKTSYYKNINFKILLQNYF